MRDVNLNFLGRVGYRDGELQQPVGEACLGLRPSHSEGEGNQALDGPIAEFAVKEVAFLHFVLPLRRGADPQHVAHNVHRDVLGVDTGQLDEQG